MEWRAATDAKANGWLVVVLAIAVVEVGAFFWLALSMRERSIAGWFVIVGGLVAIFGVVAASPIVPAFRRLSRESQALVRMGVGGLAILPGVGAVAAGILALTRT